MVGKWVVCVGPLLPSVVPLEWRRTVASTGLHNLSCFWKNKINLVVTIILCKSKHKQYSRALHGAAHKEVPLGLSVNYHTLTLERCGLVWSKIMQLFNWMCRVDEPHSLQNIFPSPYITDKCNYRQYFSYMYILNGDFSFLCHRHYFCLPQKLNILICC